MFDYIADGQMSIFDYLKDDVIKIPEPEESKKEYRIIKASDMRVIHERNFVEACTDSRICISATVKLLEGNMVYWNIPNSTR